MHLKILLINFTLCFSISVLFAQNDNTITKFDTSYYERYPYKLIISPFLVKNINTATLSSIDAEAIKYKTNTPMGIGLRVGYDWLAVSASLGTGFIDPDYKKEKGKTKALNLQTTFAARSLLVDVFFQKYQSMYLRSHKLPAYIMDSYYVRSDVQNRMLGITASYVFNGKKFSIRPPFKFDTWQKKSAGSFLAGIEYLMGSMKGDSSIIPSAFSNEFSQKQIDEMKYIVFGPNVGYGYTLVIKNIFIFQRLLHSTVI